MLANVGLSFLEVGVAGGGDGDVAVVCVLVWVWLVVGPVLSEDAA